MSKKMSKETLKELCEQFNVLTYGSTGLKAPCFCGANDHIAREFSDDITTDFKQTCENIVRMVEESEKAPDLEKQIKALQEAYKNQAARLEIVNGILNLDPNPSNEVAAALTILDRPHLELISEDTVKMPHVVLIQYTEDRQIDGIKWIKHVESADLKKDLVSSQSDKAKDSQ